MPKNWEQRERKQRKAKTGMRVTGRSVFLIEQAAAERDRRFIEKSKAKRKGKANER